MLKYAKTQNFEVVENGALLPGKITALFIRVMCNLDAHVAGMSHIATVKGELFHRDLKKSLSSRSFECTIRA